MLLWLIMLYPLIFKSNVCSNNVYIEFKATEPRSTIVMDYFILWENRLDNAEQTHFAHPSFADMRKALQIPIMVLNIIPDLSLGPVVFATCLFIGLCLA